MTSSTSPTPVRSLRPVRPFATVAVALIAAVTVASTAVSVLYLGRLGGWSWPEADLAGRLLFPYAAVHLLAGIAFVCWLFRARSNAYAISPGVAHSYAAPFLVLGWFVPVVNLFVPKGIVDDVWATSRPGGLRPGTNLLQIRRPGLVWAWWLTWLAAGCADTLAAALTAVGMEMDAEEEERAAELASGLGTAAAAAGVPLAIAAGLLAIRIVLVITRLQEAVRAAGGPAPSRHRTSYLGLVSLVVRDYDEAVGFYTGVLGFELLEDTELEDGRRWVVVRPPGAEETALLLARAATPEQEARVGDQTGGRVGLFLYTDDFPRDYERLRSAGVVFEETPRLEPYGAVAVFRDLYGNRWDLLQPSSPEGV
ncbi:DUF4328 domain-containing protein [Planomonospora parontospora]|uniref:DUF4328 domain-containing protein n=1 Tax=Planomonospora parontospora TaxID=58119 RepID=UPI001670E6E9|nr:DUF4328 domain-containing protein [Planomonospora parontospora]GGL16658.1 hypothetical protein GCM10014719_18530 [Planomonospora parontospora subsp. antibiotica]GII15336.1 hypothetical protein Ppa05_20620 [Planomonospora parontospora subsp. antibiotica]